MNPILTWKWRRVARVQYKIACQTIEEGWLRRMTRTIVAATAVAAKAPGLGAEL